MIRVGTRPPLLVNPTLKRSKLSERFEAIGESKAFLDFQDCIIEEDCREVASPDVCADAFEVYDESCPPVAD